jgi:RNA polymerase sigma factor (sigma-70 family)
MRNDDEPERELPESLEVLLGYRDRVLRSIRRRMGPKPQDIDDVAQETYLRLLRLLPGVTIDNPEAYVQRVAMNVINDFAARDLRHRERCDELARLSEADIDTSVGSLQDAVETEQELAKLTRYLRPKLLAALVLCERDGLTYEEAAPVLGVSQHTIKRWVADAKAYCMVRAKKP